MSDDLARPTSSTKRRLAVVAALLAVIAVVAALVIGSGAVWQTESGASPDDAFSATQAIPDILGVDIRWQPDADGLVRRVEPTTREQLTATWLRGLDAIARSTDGDASGLDVWFVDGALAQATTRAELSEEMPISADRWISHELRVDFYSLDGQIAVVSATSVGPSTAGHEVILVLADGNWRIRHLERVAPFERNVNEVLDGS